MANRRLLVQLASWSAVIALAACARARPQVPIVTDPATRFRAALTYDAFVRGDKEQGDRWTDAYARAAATASAFAPRARKLRGRWHLFIVAESWCSDALGSVPYLVRLAEVDSALDVRIVRRSDAPDLLRTHQFDGRGATPLVIVYDDHWVERGAWIERPAALRALIAEVRKQHDHDALSAAVSDWRAKDDGRSVLDEVLSTIERAAR